MPIHTMPFPRPKVRLPDNENYPLYPQMQKGKFFDVLNNKLVTEWGLHTARIHKGDVAQYFANRTEVLREDMFEIGKTSKKPAHRNKEAQKLGAQSWAHLRLICEDFREYAFHMVEAKLCDMGRGDRYIEAHTSNGLARFYVVGKIMPMMRVMEDGPSFGQLRPIR